MKLEDLTQEDVLELVDYDPDTGLFLYKKRGLRWFKDGYRTAEGNMNNWNATYANRPAFDTPHSKGYLEGTLLCFKVLAHRLAWFYMTGEWPEYIDHENGIRTDNRWINLRCVDMTGNNKNMAISKRNTSGVVGVYFRNDTQKWQAQICHESKTFNLGCYKTIEEATEVRKIGEQKYGFHKNHGTKKAAN